MITQFKIFETKTIRNLKTGKYYWSINNDKYKAKFQLLKIGCEPSSRVTEIINNLKLYDDETLFVGVEIFFSKIHITYRYRWSIDHRGGFFRSNAYEYMGPIKLSPEELSEVNREKNIDKFNV